MKKFLLTCAFCAMVSGVVFGQNKFGISNNHALNIFSAQTNPAEMMASRCKVQIDFFTFDVSL